MHLTEAIVALQETDLAITRAEKRLEGLPEKTAILECRRKQRDVGRLLEKARALADELGRAVGRSEDETAVVAEKMAAEQAKMTSGEVTNHKELQNLSREIDALRRKKEKQEMETVALLEKAEKADKQVATIEAAGTKLSAEEEALVETFRSAGGEVLAEIDGLKAKRGALARALPADLLERYERTREERHGIGAGILEDRTCSACGLELPSDRAQALEEGDDIGTCPMCRRILVVRQWSEENE